MDRKELPENLDEAERELREILKKDGKDIHALVLLSRILYEKGNLKESEAALRKALSLDEENREALTGLSQVLAVTGRADEAVVLLRSIVERDKADSKAWRHLGFALCRKAEMTRDPRERETFLKEAEEAFSRAMALDPEDSESAVGLASAFAARGARSRALEVLDHALEKERNAGARLKLLSEILLFSIMWGYTGKAREAALRMKQVGKEDPFSLKNIATELAIQARKMAGSSRVWKERAMEMAELLENLFN